MMARREAVGGWPRGDVSRWCRPPVDFSGRGELLQDPEIEVAVKHQPIEKENREGGSHYGIGGGSGA
jgi:hypothetical protein